MRKRRIAQTGLLAALIAIVACTGLFPSAGQAANLATNWSTGITVDGKVNDWDTLKATSFRGKDASLALAGDSTTLYLLFRTNNPQYARRIVLSGLKVYMTPKTKGATTAGLTFRAGTPLEEIRKRPGGGLYRPIPADIQRRRDSIDALGGQLTWSPQYRDRDTATVDIPIDGAQGPKAAFSFENDQYVYELSIPLNSYQGSNYKLEASPNQKVDVRLVWNTFERPHMERHRDRDSGDTGRFPGDSGGMDGDMGGFPGSGRGGVRLPGEAPDTPGPQEIRFTTTLPANSQADQGSKK